MRLLRLVVVMVAVSAGLAQAEEWSVNSAGGLKDASPQRRPYMISVYLGSHYAYYGYGWGVAGFPLGLSGRFTLPIVHDGFLQGVNDSFSLEFGLDVALFAGFGSIGIPVEAMWAFHIFPRLMVYGKLGILLGIGWARPNTCAGFYCGGIWPEPIGTVGAGLKLVDWLWLRLELGYPWTKLGVGFSF